MISYQGRNRNTLNYLKTIYFDYPEWTPAGVGLMPATWMKYREDLEEIVLAHPRLFPKHLKGQADFTPGGNPLYQLGRHVDCWGTVWENVQPGLDSMPVEFPLADWAVFDSYRPPDPLKDDLFGPRPGWEVVRRRMQEAKARGDLAWGSGLGHGFMYMRLFFLRGFENLMLDLATDDPRLPRLIRMVEDYNTTVINKDIELGAEICGVGEDLGLQHGLPMSPAMWRRYIKPSYERMFRLCRERDMPVSQHTDGHILEIIPDLIEVGIRVLNPQIRANGLEGLQRVAKGKVALVQDLDRQLFPFATPSQIEDHIGEVFEGLYLPQGGLTLSAECEPDVPLTNIEAICAALEKFCHLPDPQSRYAFP